MRVYPENTEFGEKRIKKRVRHTPPFIPPHWGNEFNNSPPWRGAVLRRRGCFSFFNGYSKIMKKLHKQNFAK
jgi:hypothetical protein